MGSKTEGRAGGRSLAGTRASQRRTSERRGDASGEGSPRLAQFAGARDLQFTSARDVQTPERLVGLGFRGWITGYQQGDVGCWGQVWRLYADQFGAARAEVAVADLAGFAKSVSACSRRRLEVAPLEACAFCRDESLAISLIAACQHNTCPALRACAFALVESSMLDDVLHHAGSFALTLRTLDAVVPPGWIVNANAFVGSPAITVN